MGRGKMRQKLRHQPPAAALSITPIRNSRPCACSLSRTAAHQPLGLRDDLPRTVDAEPPGLGQGDMARRARQKAAAQVLLQQPDMPPEGGRQHVHPLRGARPKCSVSANRDQASELLELHGSRPLLQIII